MTKYFLVSIGLAWLGLNASSLADPIDETTSLLKTPSARAVVIQKDPEAKKADDRVKSLGLGAGGEQKVYELSSGIFEKMALESGGDAEKMSNQVQKLLRDPGSIEKQLTPEQRAQIHDLANEAESNSAVKLISH